MRPLSEKESEAIKVLQRAGRRGRVLRSALVKAARRKGHPLHHRFNWDVEKAAMSHWLTQAKDIIQLYVITIEGSSAPVRALVHVPGDGDGYIPIQQAMSSSETVHRLRAAFAGDLLAVLKRYEYLRAGLPEAFAAVEQAATVAGGARVNGASERVGAAVGATV